MDSLTTLPRKVLFAFVLAFVTWMMPWSRGMASPASAATGAASAEDAQDHPPRCRLLDLYYFQSLPGVVSNCYARRKWEQGHYRAGLERFKRAASWGSKEAQYALGLIYYTGRHVPVNKPLGLAWLELAAERNDPQKSQVAKSAERLATADEMRQARQLLSHMRERYADEVAAKRAWKHYQHARIYVAMAKMNGVMPDCESLPAGGSPDQNAANFAAEISCWQRKANKRRLEGQRKSLVEQYFEGWAGTVDVGPLQMSPAPAATSGD